MNELNITDIHSYTVFADIDKRNGKIEGHMMILSKKQMEAIEDIVLSGEVQVKEKPLYEIEKQ